MDGTTVIGLVAALTTPSFAVPYAGMALIPTYPCCLKPAPTQPLVRRHAPPCRFNCAARFPRKEFGPHIGNGLVMYQHKIICN